MYLASRKTITRCKVARWRASSNELQVKSGLMLLSRRQLIGVMQSHEYVIV